MKGLKCKLLPLCQTSCSQTNTLLYNDGFSLNNSKFGDINVECIYPIEFEIRIQQ